jgi:hypothetical protein
MRGERFRYIKKCITPPNYSISPLWVQAHNGCLTGNFLTADRPSDTIYNSVLLNI